MQASGKQQGKQQILQLRLCCQRALAFQLCCLQHTSLSCNYSNSCLQFPWGTSHGSGIFSSSQVSQYKARYHFHCITQWPLRASTRTPLPQAWAQRFSLTTDEDSHSPFIHLFLLTLQSEQHGQHCQVTADLGWSLATKFSAAFLRCLLGAENSSGLFTS